MKPKSSGSFRQRVSLRMIAAAAKVSVMTVSYALRGRREVSATERLRITRLAESMGYRPDPMLTHLMQHLRSQRTLKSAANLAVLTSLDAEFVRRLLAGAFARADHLGYHLDQIDVRSSVPTAKSLTRTLLARGVSGLLLAPVADPAVYSSLLDWSQFATVAMTYSVVEPHVHRVVTHHFDNAVRTFDLMEKKGFKRIGLAMTADMEFRANHSYSGAYFRTGQAGLRERAPILFFNESGRAGIRAWFMKHKPDAIVVANASQVRNYLTPALGARLREKIAVVCLDHEMTAHVSGIDQLFETVGGHAIDSLVAHIHRNEYGLPEEPTVTMVKGRWIDSYGYHPMK